MKILQHTLYLHLLIIVQILPVWCSAKNTRRMYHLPSDESLLVKSFFGANKTHGIWSSVSHTAPKRFVNSLIKELRVIFILLHYQCIYLFLTYKKSS